MKIPRCPNRDCRPSGKTVSGSVTRFGFYQTRWGRRRRYRCQTCEKTFCSTTGTPYYRLQHRRDTFDQVARLSVEGLNKSAIARVEGIGWNTVDRWLEKASDCGRRFNNEKTTGFSATEIQADEIRTIVPGRQQPIWIFAAIEVWSRLWSATVVGRRSYENTLTLFQDIAARANDHDIPLITTDGFEFYGRVIGQVFWTRMHLRPGRQDASEQSCYQSGTSSGDWDGKAIRGKTAALGGLLDAEHVVYRTAESDDPARFGVSLPENDMSGSPEATSGRTPRVVEMLLQFRAPASVTEVWAGNSDARDTSGIEREATDATEHLLFGNPSGIVQIRVRVPCSIILG